MKTPWTAGPWRIGLYGDVNGMQFDVIAKMPEEGAGEQTILTTINGRRPETEDKANATLAAAAPELYETLVWALAEIDKHERDYHHTTPDQNVAAAEALLQKANPERPTDGQ
jgi:hypothetical protein